MTKEGLPNKEIAKQLDLSRTTVSNVRKQLRVQGKL
ncbi:MAG: response regulator transcription factor [Puniceicoccaceae bacterium]|nr:response regulator transcription factor [Puniceicoccaceae bacterium]